MFRTVPLSIIRSFSLYTQQQYKSYRFADSLLASCQHTGRSLTENTKPEAVLIQFDLLMMSTDFLDACRGLK